MKRPPRSPAYPSGVREKPSDKNSNPFAFLPAWLRQPYVCGALLIVLTLLAYFPALFGNFIWDDDDNVTANPTLRSLIGLKRIWLQPGATQQYYPLTHTSFWLEYHLWGLHPLGYHAVNLALHIASALLLWKILRVLRVPGAWLAAAIFAVHPVGVESVAWITERKNTLSGVFFLGSIWMALKFWLPQLFSASTTPKTPPASGSWKFYCLCLFLYLCALLSKTATIGLPAVIVLLLWWQRRRFVPQDALLLLPFLACGFATGLITLFVEKNHVGAAGADWNFSVAQRLVICGHAVWFYLGKLFWPHPLMFIYPRWKIFGLSPLSFIPLALALIAAIVFWRFRKSWGRPLFFVFGCFVALLFPVLGFFNVFFFRYSFVCDHFQYLAQIAPLALFAACLLLVLRRVPVFTVLIAGVLILALGALTFHQTRIYHDRKTLWTDSLIQNPEAFLAANNLGVEYDQLHDPASAMELYRRAIEMKPDYGPAHNNLGTAFLAQHKIAEAILCFQSALQIDPTFAEAHNNIGKAFHAKGDLAAAITQFQLATELKPTYAEAHYNLGNAYTAVGRPADAIVEFHKALALSPDLVAARNNLGDALLRSGQVAEATTEYQNTLTANPNFAEGQYNLGNAFLEKGDWSQAIAHFEKALSIRPNFVEAEYGLGNASRSQGDLDQAIAAFRHVLQLKPDFAEARNNLASALMKRGDVDEAIRQLEQTIQAKPDFAEAYNNLGSALLKQSNPGAAIAQFKSALRLKPDFAEAHYNLGNALLKQQNFSAAMAEYQAAFTAKPDFAEAHYNLSSALYQTGDYSHALTEYETAVRLNPQFTNGPDRLGHLLREKTSATAP